MSQRCDSVSVGADADPRPQNRVRRHVAPVTDRHFRPDNGAEIDLCAATDERRRIDLGAGADNAVRRCRGIEQVPRSGKRCPRIRYEQERLAVQRMQRQLACRDHGTAFVPARAVA